jgi:hypothetical protein
VFAFRLDMVAVENQCGHVESFFCYFFPSSRPICFFTTSINRSIS